MRVASSAGQLISANYGGSGGASAGGGGGGSANPVTAPISPGATSVVTPTQQQGSITINVNGVITDQILNDLLLPALQDAIENRDFVLITNNSRNGQNLLA